MLKAGDLVKVVPDWCDEAEEDLEWVVCDNEEKGRVLIRPLHTQLPFPPTQTVRVDMVTRVDTEAPDADDYEGLM